MINERKGIKRSTLLATVWACQYELKFESIQLEWNRNERIWNMMLTLWLDEETMYLDSWEEQDPPVTLHNGSINWKCIMEANHHWDVEEEHTYPYRLIGQKLWPNPHLMVSDGSRCSHCQGPEGCYQVGSYRSGLVNQKLWDSKVLVSSHGGRPRWKGPPGRSA